MAELTVDKAEAQLSALAKSLIQQLRQQFRKSSTVTVEAAEIDVFEGETYLGPVLNDDGSVHHYSILLPVLEGGFNFDAAGKSAEERGGHRPSLAEGFLIRARLFTKLKWFWLDKEDGASFAWGCGSYGDTYIVDRSAEGAGVAVRRVFPSDL